MGVAIYIQGYEKDPGCIRGEIKTLGMYEVYWQGIASSKIPGTEAVVHNGLESFNKLKGQVGYLLGCDPHELKNIQFLLESIPSNMDGWGIKNEGDKTFVVMFEASNILNMVIMALDTFDEYSSDLYSKDEELEELNVLKSLLESVSSKNGIVELRIG